MAYYLVKCDNSISKYSANTIWILILMLLPISCTCTLYRDTPSWLAISMVAPLKWVFPFCFGWIILSPRLGHKNFVTKALAHNMFYHFGHMAYSFYLLNPLILIIVNGASNNPVPVDAAQLLVATFGICLMTFIFSIICTISIEMPCIKLLRIYTSQPKNNEVSSKSELQVKV
uniref:CSON011070 protein n=1 Tax=Culicoides sonorensis TaxID=179676 RepID=A0A336K1X3_CULSO